MTMRLAFWTMMITMTAGGIMVHATAADAPAADQPPAVGQVAPYTIKSTYATPETCAYKTQGVFIVWWDKNFDYATQAADTLETLAAVRDECLGTYHMSDPPNPLAGYYYDVHKITNTAAATYTFRLKGDAKGSEGAAAAFQGRVVVRTGAAARQYPLTMADATTGQRKVEVAATDADVYLIVAATPGCFSGNQTYSYEVKIDRT
ncbi:MAG: hypothetical protein K9N23_11180 [Akkermansiaceae bacterium]|nr:hypothetical protein [Akkermansiaceae bacterium]MCF7732245.1 hypothetical protein [Akkermansiaceae bacterium]